MVTDSICTGLIGLSFEVGTLEMLTHTSYPSMTLPKTGCCEQTNCDPPH
jgi:hypothetical protein